MQADPSQPVKQAVVTSTKKRRQGSRAGTVDEADAEAKKETTGPNSNVEARVHVEPAAIAGRPHQQAVVTPTWKRYASEQGNSKINYNRIIFAREAMRVLHDTHACTCT